MEYVGIDVGTRACSASVLDGLRTLAFLPSSSFAASPSARASGTSTSATTARLHACSVAA